MSYVRLFNAETQGSGSAVSSSFRTDGNINIALTMPTALRIHGTLDGGTLKLQTLDPPECLSENFTQSGLSN